MANILLTDFNYQYNGALSEVFFKPTESTPALSDLFTIIDDSAYQVQLHLANPLSNILKKGTGCGRTVTGSVDFLENRTLIVDELEMFVEECAKDFEGVLGNIIAERALKSGVNRNDISGTEVESIITDLLMDALRRDNFRIASFADKTSANTDYNQTNGLWTRLVAEAGPSGYCVNRVGGALGTGALAADVALDTLKLAYEGSSNILDERADKTFWVTRSVFDNLVSSYESVSTGSDLQVTQQQEGIPMVRYRGVPVNKVASWDTNLAQATNPLNATVRHLILYTIRENHVLNVHSDSDLNNIEGWYSRDDNIYKFESRMRYGYNFKHCDLATIAF